MCTLQTQVLVFSVCSRWWRKHFKQKFQDQGHRHHRTVLSPQATCTFSGNGGIECRTCAVTNPRALSFHQRNVFFRNNSQNRSKCPDILRNFRLLSPVISADNIFCDTNEEMGRKQTSHKNDGKSKKNRKTKTVLLFDEKLRA